MVKNDPQIKFWAQSPRTTWICRVLDPSPARISSIPSVGGGVDFFLELPILGRQVKLQLNWIMALSLQVQQLTFWSPKMTVISIKTNICYHMCNKSIMLQTFAQETCYVHLQERKMYRKEKCEYHV